MFILYAPLLGVIAGLLAGGRLERLAEVRFRGLALLFAAMAVQGPLFGPLGGLLPAGSPFGIALYLGSSIVALGVVLGNRHLPAMPLLALGATLNLAAIVANGGMMPAAPDALRSLGWAADAGGFSNSALVPAPMLGPLTDVFALPRWLPLANVFSIGDVLIGIALARFLVVTMTRPVRPEVVP